MNNLDGLGIDPKAYDEILKQFEKIKVDAGFEPEDEYKKEIEDIISIGFDELEEEI